MSLSDATNSCVRESSRRRHRETFPGFDIVRVLDFCGVSDDPDGEAACNGSPGLLTGAPPPLPTLRNRTVVGCRRSLHNRPSGQLEVMTMKTSTLLTLVAAAALLNVACASTPEAAPAAEPAMAAPAPATEAAPAADAPAAG